MEAVENAHQIASEIKAEVAKPEPDPSRLKQLSLSAVTAGGGVLGQAAATHLIHLASHALQTFRLAGFCGCAGERRNETARPAATHRLMDALLPVLISLVMGMGCRLLGWFACV